MKKTLLLFISIFLFNTISFCQQSVARQWCNAMLNAIITDFAKPPVQARNLFHVSLAMYDAWAVYDNTASPYLIGKTVGSINYPFTGVPFVAPANIESYRNMAISYAAYKVLKHRFANSPNAVNSITSFNNLMTSLGYDYNYTQTNYSTGNAADLGNFIGNQVIAMGLADGSNESNNYQYVNYLPVNDPQLLSLPINMADPNRWQPLILPGALDQNGNPIPATQIFITPEWGRVLPFSMATSSAIHYSRNGGDFPVYYDPGTPPMLDTISVSNLLSQEFKWGHSMVAAWSSHLDPTDPTLWDISPNAKGNVINYPTTLVGLHSFYNFDNGGDNGIGYSANPVTGLPYVPQMVKRGDFTRLVTQYWADGPSSETPPGHWFTLLNQVSDYPGFIKKYEGVGAVLSNLEWDVKSYFTLGAAMHDAAIACWGIKGWYDSPRPISAIRKMALYGQCSNAALPSYHPGGIPLNPGFVELVMAGDPLQGYSGENINKIKIKAWRGFNFILNAYTDWAGVGWILAEKWVPYQRKTFNTPPFAGYVSGHSTYSRAGAFVLTNITGSPYFPGGLGEYVIPANSNILGFEKSPDYEIKLQWASYKDASDEASMSRIWGGIHPGFDDMPGRRIGELIGNAAHVKAKTYFTNTILPIDLLYCIGKEKDCSTQLQWATTAELQTKSFVIWKSIDGVNFDIKLTEIAAAGNTNNIRNYSYTDISPNITNYYKIVQFDINNKQTILPIIHIDLKNCNAIVDKISSIYPNPVEEKIKFTIQNNTKNSFSEITILDEMGQKKYSTKIFLQAGINKINLPSTLLSKGIYFVKIKLSGGKNEVQKVVKLN